MVSRFSEICIDCRNPKRLADFWCAALGYKILEVSSELIEIGPADLPTNDDFAEWKARLRAAPSAPTLLFVVVPESKTIKNRLHIDISPIDATHEEEVERMLSLGATKADVGQGEVSWTVMRDPEGNEFCVLRSLKP
ncbi:MAG: VOC family protein [Actinomycetota bacterium]